MGNWELGKKYHRNKIGQAINAAIRAELPAGNAVLDLINMVYGLRGKATGELRSELDQLFRELQEARKEMVQAIADRYELENITWGKDDEHERSEAQRGDGQLFCR